MSKDTIIYATKRLIDSVWTLGFKVVNEENNEIEIVSFDRDNPIGYEQEKTLPRCGIIEDKDRTITGVYIKEYEGFKYWASKDDHDKEYKVVNPKYVFSYS